jgi:hypothetical protein
MKRSNDNVLTKRGAMPNLILHMGAALIVIEFSPRDSDARRHARFRGFFGVRAVRYCGEKLRSCR